MLKKFINSKVSSVLAGMAGTALAASAVEFSPAGEIELLSGWSAALGLLLLVLGGAKLGIDKEIARRKEQKAANENTETVAWSDGSVSKIPKDTEKPKTERDYNR